MMTENFSWSRIWLLIKRDCIENRRNLLMTFGVMFGVMLMIGILVTKASDSVTNDVADPIMRATVLLPILLWISVIMMQIIGSLTFCDWTSKPKRIASMMTPAAQSEKFFSRLLVYVVGGNIALVLCLFLSDTLSALIFAVKPVYLSFSRYTYLIDDYSAFAFLTVTLLLCALYSQTSFVIGSAIWPRKSYLKTFVALLVLQILIPIILPFNLLGDFVFRFREITQPIAWTLVCLGYIILVALYYVAWAIYKRTQVIQRFKMT